MDVSSLYTNIDTTHGLECVKKTLQENPVSDRPDDLILDILDLCLKNNYFEFNGKMYHQVSGTAMGHDYAPDYANIYMAHWERHIDDMQNKPSYYKRFLDDIYMHWEHGEEKFMEFFEFKRV